MKFLRIIFNVLKILLKINTFKTLYFNFKVLPIKQAIKLPFHFYGNTQFANLNGQFILNCENIKFGMIIFGGKHEVVFSSNVSTRIYNSGKIEFEGNAHFARGINLMVWKNGALKFGENFSLGSLSKIICFREIIFQKNVLISWESQFFDTDFHFIKYENIIKDNCGSLLVEDNVWIGSRVTVLKNTIISTNSIVASNSLCSGNYKTKFGDGNILGGVPAKLLQSNVLYFKNKQQEIQLFDYFNTNRGQSIEWIEKLHG